jgi:hypothetical protein
MCACLSFVFGVCLFFESLCLSCFVLSCAYLFFDCVLLLIFCFRLLPTCLLFVSSYLLFCFKFCFEGGFFLVTLSQQYIWHTIFFWSRTPSSQYVPYNKSLCFEGVLFRHMINMFSWSQYPSNILPYINSLCFEGVLFRHTILAIHTTHNSTRFTLTCCTHPNLSLKTCLTGIGTHPNLSLKMCLMGNGTHPKLSLKMWQQDFLYCSH